MSSTYHPARPIAAGVLFAASVALFADGIATSHQDPQAKFHATFIDWLPFLSCVVGYILINFTTAATLHAVQSQHGHGQVETMTAAMGWAAMFAGTVMALVQCGTEFVPPSTRVSGALGVSSVVVTLFMAVSAVVLWARDTPDSAYAPPEDY